MTSADMRKYFFAALLKGIRVVWPILSGLLTLMALFGVAIGWLEHWSWGDGIYFAFVSGLTIGYGDLVAKHLMSRVLAIGCGFIGILLMGLVTAIGVKALEAAWQAQRQQ